MIDFFIVGAVKAGTTSLHRYLQQHPAIEMSRAKWTRFFHVDGAEPDFGELAQRYGQRLLPESMGRFRLMCHHGVPRSFDTYLKQWDWGRANVLRGEAAPTYMYDEYACARIKTRCPNAKIIMVLRTPIDRALSHFSMDLANNWVPEQNFIDAVKAEPYQVDCFWWGLRHYLRHGFYTRPLLKAQHVFGTSKLKVMLYDDLLANPQGFMADIINFLEIDSFTFDISEWHNCGQLAKPTLNEVQIDTLKRLYQPEVEQLQDIIKRDLSSWH